jgi:signal transduction histidine kinase/ActR/RegA family two-component response regulator
VIAMPALSTNEIESRVLLLVATKKDADVSQRLLSRAGLQTTVCESIGHLTAEIEIGAAAVLTTDQMLEESRVDELLRVLEIQADWSDLPFIILMSGGAQSERATRVFARLTNATILERPAGMRTVLSTVQAAVRGRLRQYQTRSHLQALEAAEASARQAGHAKDDFLAALSHELRTPLTPVLLLSTEAAADSTLSPTVRRDFDTIARNVALEARLIDDLLDLTRITRGKLKLEMKRVDVISVLRDAIDIVQSDFKLKKLEIATVFEAASATVECDSIRIQQVFWNLLKNAAKFTPPSGKITIRTQLSADPPRIVIQIADTGIGMTEAEVARAFEAFAQGDHAASGCSHRFGGLGLGLAISRSVVELHSGTITAKSEGPAKGSTFNVELPLALKPDDATSPSAPLPPTGDASHRSGFGLRVMLVEDHQPTRDVLKRLMNARKHHVVATATLAEARSQAKKGTFDLLMTDIGLPDGSGYDLMKELTTNGDVLAVALTGFGMDDDVERSKNTGFFAHLTKPLRATELDAVLRAVIQVRRGRPADSL